MSIYSCFTGKSFEEIEKEFEGRGYGDFKLAVGEACADGLAPIQEEFKRLMADKAYLEGVMRDNADQASYIARKTLSKVYRKVGFLAKP
jgi:tryptophanyl-tRNA synthetase